MKTYKNLFNKIVDINNLIKAFEQTSKGKSSIPEFLEFEKFAYANLNKLRFELINGSYSVGEYIHFTIMDPKPRNITALQFRDRIVQRAIYNIIQPIFDKSFLSNSYACRKNMGTHKCAKVTQSYMRKKGVEFYLKTDFSKYFLSIDRKILWNQIERKISCVRTLELIELFIPRNGVGINIGELLSQLFANVYGNIVDQFIKHILKVKYFSRYMDDIVIFGDSIDSLREIKEKLKCFIENDLNLKFSKWFIKPCSKGVNFVGYRIFKNFKLIRKDSIKRAKRKIKYYKNIKDEIKLRMFLGSWHGHIRHADTYNLRKRMGIDEILLQHNNNGVLWN